MKPSETKRTRIYFLDNIRFFVIFFVILQHAALIYAYGGSRDFQKFYSFIVGITDIFMMPLLFFIAGYFALISMRKYGPKGFFLAKIKRIWIPWLLGVFLVLPLSIYFTDMVKLLRAGKEIQPFSAHFLQFIKTALTPHFGFYHAGLLSHRHLWFLSLLMGFFTIFSVTYPLMSPLFRKKERDLTVRPAINRDLIMAGFVSAFLFALVSLWLGWGYKPVLVANLLYFDSSRTSMYVIYFLLGIHACRQGWFDSGFQIAGSGLWKAAAVLSFAAFIAVGYIIKPDNSTSVIILNSCIRAALTLSLMVVIIDCAAKRFNQRNGLTAVLADNSFIVYIIHYPLHGALGVLFFFLPMLSLIKMLMLFAVTTVMSYWLSDSAVRPHPRLSTACMAVLTVILLFLF